LSYDSEREVVMRRNYKFWQEVEDFKTYRNIENNNSYLLSIHGKEDYENHIELDQKLVAELTNTYKPGFAEFRSIDSLDHNFSKSIGAFKVTGIDNKITPKYSNEFADIVFKWIKKTNEKSLNIKSIPPPRDESLINLKRLAKEISANSKTTKDQVSKIISWANENLKWVATDYNNRNAKEIISRGGGNCNEEAIVVLALLDELGIETRKIREINIQPDNLQREKDAKRLIKLRGNSLSVFGLRHNDHIWIEYFDFEKNTWQPADPTLNLVGMEEWIKARLGFSHRKTHEVINSQDMIAPFSLVVVDHEYRVINDRSEYYLIERFNKIYNNKLEKLSSWRKWKKGIVNLSQQGLMAFKEELNLHDYNDDIFKLKKVYLELMKEYNNK
jgi:transglutaminase-like putative cysteine protease